MTPPPPASRRRGRKRPPHHAAPSAARGGFYAAVYAAVRRIPRGRVATYGQLALLLANPRGARAVGWALRALDSERTPGVPWHRVVGAGGRISPRAGPGPRLQARLLAREGVRLRDGRVDLAQHGILA